MTQGIRQGDVVWADYGEPLGSEPGFRRPVVVVQSDPVNRSKIGTVLCVPLTSNLLLAKAPGNLMLKQAETGLNKDSVANVAQIGALDRSRLGEWAGAIGSRHLQAVFSGIDLILGR